MRGIVARCAGHAAAGVRARTAHVQASYRSAIVAVAKRGAGRPELIERHMAVHDVAADQPEFALEVERRMDLPRDDRRLEIGRVPGDGLDDQVGGGFTLVVPAATVREDGRKLLAEQAGDVHSRGREAVVDGRRDHDFDDRSIGPALCLCIDERLIHVI